MWSRYAPFIISNHLTWSSDVAGSDCDVPGSFALLDAPPQSLDHTLLWQLWDNLLFRLRNVKLRPMIRKGSFTADAWWCKVDILLNESTTWLLWYLLIHNVRIQTLVFALHNAIWYGVLCDFKNYAMLGLDGFLLTQIKKRAHYVWYSDSVW